MSYTLSHEWPRMDSETRAVVENKLATHVRFEQRCQSATFRKRQISGRYTVEVQCDTCGRSVGGPIARKKVINWQALTEWDYAIGPADDAQRQVEIAEWLENQAAARETQRVEQRAERRRQYAVFLNDSPEWRDIRTRVAARAARVCEACLIRPAHHVHHRTYDHGILPPAWHLRAVCRQCHDRLHDRDDEWYFA